MPFCSAYYTIFRMDNLLHDILLVIATALLAVLHLLSATHALLHKREPYAALVWVSVCLFVPIFGPLIYIVLGFNRIQRRAHRLMRKSVRQAGPQTISAQVDVECDPEKEICQIIEEDELGTRELSASPSAVPLSMFPPRIRRIAGIGERITRVPMLSGNLVEALFNGDEAYPPMLAAIEDARSRVWLTTYIFDNDHTGKIFIEALSRAVDRGVDVRVLVDGVGTFTTRPRIDRVMRQHGIKVGRFLPPRLFPPQFSINLRNHRKLLIVDDCTCFTGGMNITDTHLVDKPEKKGFWARLGKLVSSHTAKDLHFKVCGPIVNIQQRIFARDWEFCTYEKLEIGASTTCTEIQGNSFCRSILAGPDDYFAVFESILLGVISAAKSTVHIMTPYFLPQRELITALESAVLRGVDVTVLIPEECDHRFVKWATYNCLWSLLERGMKIYFQEPPFDHSKLLIVDGAYVHMGSANLDPRSLRLNFELTMEILDLPLAIRLETHFSAARAKSKEYTLQDLNSRPLHIRMRDAFFWIFSPYL